MPFSMGIDLNQDLRWAIYSGAISMLTVQDANAVMKTQTGWRPGLDFFVDISQTSSIDLDFTEMMAIASLTFRGKTDTTRSRMAVYYDTEHQFGMARILASAVHSTQTADVELFKNDTDALIWLDRDFASFEAVRATSKEPLTN